MYICEKCSESVQYSEQWDTYFCDKCNKWCEPKCGYKECLVCAERPLRPKKNHDKHGK